MDEHAEACSSEVSKEKATPTALNSRKNGSAGRASKNSPRFGWVDLIL
jgi:hypothetical protein